MHSTYSDLLVSLLWLLWLLVMWPWRSASRTPVPYQVEHASTPSNEEPNV